ncbi:hypothetical protein BJ875DRAFT_438623 [Amylocarpus encephaloides]|uniref:Uncharacterized protein n=1 Tax=Amylocarpus encephaloides TaxID=45428 RepID=A0A9P8C8C5_9HELO|nr:hypothetical protein BJ875DRAFT_438623 [Amylocarpus encephaloides]
MKGRVSLHPTASLNSPVKSPTKPYYGTHVIKLDLSGILTTISEPNGDLKELTGWARVQIPQSRFPLAGLYSMVPGSPWHQIRNPSRVIPFLKASSKKLGFPIGSLCHIVKAWLNTKYLNLGSSDSPHISKSTTNVFSTNRSDKSRLRHPEVFKARNVLWVTALRLENIVDNAHPDLQRIYFKGSGQSRRAKWSIKVSGEVLKTIAKELVEGEESLVCGV